MISYRIFKILLFIVIQFCATNSTLFGQSNNQYSVIGYYAGSAESVNYIDAQKLTHIIHSFSFLQGNKLHVETKEDSLTIKNLVALKRKNPKLKVLLSLGGWGGCATCSDVFSNKENRKRFSRSVKKLCKYFDADGIDLDWEFPALPSLPGHSYKPEDKHNFTLLVQQLRKTLGRKKEISFAAGGFKWTLNQSIEWPQVMKTVDRVHLMSYDFTRSNTGHHTALFSTTQQKSSADYFIQYLLQMGVPADKIILGSALYARKWDSIAPVNNGLYQPGKEAGAISFSNLNKTYTKEKGFEKYWDAEASAPYLYNRELLQFISYEDERSIKTKAKYVMDKKLGGIMFWQLAHDLPLNSLVPFAFDFFAAGNNSLH